MFEFEFDDRDYLDDDSGLFLLDDLPPINTERTTRIDSIKEGRIDQRILAQITARLVRCIAVHTDKEGVVSLTTVRKKYFNSGEREIVDIAIKAWLKNPPRGWQVCRRLNPNGTVSIVAARSLFS